MHKNVLYITSNNEFHDKFLNLYKKYIKALSIMNIFTNKNKNCMPINNEKITLFSCNDLCNLLMIILMEYFFVVNFSNNYLPHL